MLARDEVAGSNTLKVPVAGQAKVPIAWKLAVERLDVLKIAVDGRRGRARERPSGESCRMIVSPEGKPFAFAAGSCFPCPSLTLPNFPFA